MNASISSSNTELIELLSNELSNDAKSNLIDFIHYIKWDYEANWHHFLITDKLNNFLESDAKRLMLFVPPQHGKSEIASRCLPAYYLGKNPDSKIAACSYTIDLSRSFSRAVQDYIKSDYFTDVFPDIEIGHPANTDEFGIKGHKGKYKAVGVLGGLTGHSVDLAIIDDPVKDQVEANSETYRERVWQWYLNVLSTRLHNESKVILIMTRWHEDDLAGRLLEYEPEKWEVIRIPAIKEDDSLEEDPRQIGDPLWPEKHNLEKLNDLRALSEDTFTSLYQQNPTTPGGNKVKDEWFEYCYEKEVPSNLVVDIWIDGAYTKKTENDPSGIMVCAHDKRARKLYILHAQDAFMELPEMLKLVPEVAELFQLASKSQIHIEPKASGKSLGQMLRANTNLSAVEIRNHLVQEGKESRLQVAAPKIKSGRVVLVRGVWNSRFKKQITGFPKVKHDEYVDLIGYACYQYFDRGRSKKSGVKRRN